MNGKIWNIGIIGLGVAAEKHAEAIAELPNAKLLAVSTGNLEKRRDWMRRWGCNGYMTSRDLLLDQNIDIVIVTTPSGTHADYAMKALAMGHHVIVEKPLEITTARCDSIIRTEKKYGKRSFTIFQNRYSDIIRTLNTALVNKRFGELTLCSAYQKWWRDPEYYEGSWHGTKALDGGGCLMNQAIHAVDLLLYLAGDIKSVSAMKTNRFHKDIEVEDTLVSALEFESGALGTIECSTASNPGTARRMELRGTKGSVIIEDEMIKLWQFDEETDQDRIIREHFSKETASNGSASASDFTSENHRRQLSDILDALERGRACMTDSRAGRNATHAVEAIYRSADTNQRIWL